MSSSLSSTATADAVTPDLPQGMTRLMITLSIMLATIMQALDTTIANVALPNMQGSLSATQDQVSWVLTSYIVAAAIMTPPTGFLAARMGRRRLFLVSVVGFTVASALCGLAQSLEQMVAFRLLQGVFGAGLVPLSQSVLLDTYPKEKHGSAMALWGIGVMVGPILGPTLGGWLTEYYDWRWVFFINIPIGIIAWMGLAAFVPESQRVRRRFDFHGFALLSLGIGALQMMLDRGELLDWFSSTEVVIETVLAVVALYLFVVHILTARKVGRQPFVDPGMFRDRNFAVGMVFIFVVGIILLATMALLPPFLQNLMGYPVLTSGMVLAPRGFGTMTAMFIVGRVIGRVDARLLIVLGLGLIAGSLWEMSLFTLEVPTSMIISTGIVQGMGLGFVFVPLSTMTFATLDPRYRTEGTSFYSLMRNIGSSIGISVVTTRLSQGTQVNHAGLIEHTTPFAQAFQDGLPAVVNPHSAQGLAVLNQLVTQQAAALAYLDDFRFMAFVTLAALPLLLLVRLPKTARR